MEFDNETGTVNVRISIEDADVLVGDMIKYSFKGMQEDLEKFYDNRDHYLHIDDVKDFVRWMEAMKVVYEYYTGSSLDDDLLREKFAKTLDDLDATAKKNWISRGGWKVDEQEVSKFQEDQDEVYRSRRSDDTSD